MFMDLFACRLTWVTGDIRMKLKYLWVVLFVMTPLLALAQGTDKPGTPSVYVPEPLFQFDPVVSGKNVSHDYIVQNRGTAELEITSVKTG